MISHVLASMLFLLQSGSTAQAREAYAACLDDALRSNLESRASAAAFDRAATTGCAARAAAFRNAILAAETAAGSSRAEAEELANMEVEDLAGSMRDLYRFYLEDGSRPK